MTQTQTPEVEITVSAPYIAIGGGWTSQRQLGQRRTYTATTLGKDFQNTSKSEIQNVIRAAYHRAGINRVRFTFVDSQEG